MKIGATRTRVVLALAATLACPHGASSQEKQDTPQARSGIKEQVDRLLAHVPRTPVQRTQIDSVISSASAEQAKIITAILQTPGQPKGSVIVTSGQMGQMQRLTAQWRNGIARLLTLEQRTNWDANLAALSTRRLRLKSA